MFKKRRQLILRRKFHAFQPTKVQVILTICKLSTYSLSSLPFLTLKLYQSEEGRFAPAFKFISSRYEIMSSIVMENSGFHFSLTSDYAILTKLKMGKSEL